jgi:carbamoylphosphate synthase large subunit
MRDDAILMMRSLGNFSGGCNVQFALNPENEEIDSRRDKSQSIEIFGLGQ